MKTKHFTLMFAIVASMNLWAADSGSCGDHLTWTLDDNGTLTISGTGNMNDYDYSGPWGRDENIKTVIINVGVTSIGDYAFYGCYGLTSITIPNSVTSIGNRAFGNCRGLTSITIPNSVTSIGEWAFSYCSSLTSITIPNSVTSIGDNAFNYCSGLTSINIPNSVTSIGEGAFYCCTALTSVTIPNSVTSIGESAFARCSGLTSLTIPNSVTSIGESAFARCSGLTSITIPNSVTSIGEQAFYGCNSLTSVTLNSDTIVSKSYTSSPNIGNIFGTQVKEYIIGNSVTSIGNSAFSGCSGLASITIPNSVTSIGEWAFDGCISLTSITIPNSVTSIGELAFSGCNGLTSVTIPNSVTSIGEWAFSYCKISSINYIGSLEEWINKNWNPAVISSNYTLLLNGVEQTSITIPNSITSIGNYAFYGCSGLTSITIPNSVTSIGDHAFSYCKISSINYIGSLEEWINKNWNPTVISRNYTLLLNGVEQTSITIPNSVTSIGNGAFSGCSGLTSITIPNSVTSIGDYAFYGCSGLTSITIPNSVTSIRNYVFEGCSSLTSITVPNSVTSIGDRAFWGCSGLTSITIPNSVTSIGEIAFYGCSGLKNVILGSSLKVIEESAFRGCSSIETITCYSQRPPTIKDNALNGLNYSTIVYVPADYLDTYKMHDAWGLYDVRPLGAKSTQTDNVQVTPQENTADIVWPAVSGASTYELVIKDKQGNIICTLIFNAQGQLTQLVFNAPAANGKQMPEQTQTAGFSFTITGLNQGTTYDYTITSKDADGNALDTKIGTFTTNGATCIEDVIDTQHLTHPTKVLIDGAVYIIMPDGRRYNLQGAEVK